MTQPHPTRLLAHGTHTTHLPASVVHEALALLATGSSSQRMRAAQMLASAYADDEERRLASDESA